jgi:thiol-disulfide isomerase/thioredoxin
MLLWYEIDKNNPLLHKVCTGIIKGNCNTILTGKASKVVSWLSWSEVGFFYFAGSFLCIVSDPINPLPYILNLLTLPYIVFSIYYQGVVAKQWCLLCLSIQALLLLGGINTIANHSWKFVSDLNLQNTSIALLLYLLPVLLWYSLKAVVLKLQKAKHTKRQYLRLKFAADIFNTLLQKQKTVNISSVARLGIDIGPPHAEHTIIKVCNPYCGPCSKAHPEIERLMEENPNVKVKIIFTANTDEKDFRNKPVKHLLAIADRNNEQVTKQALDDWYLADKKDYAIFSEKYPMNGEIAQQENKIVAMEKWCEETGIKFTPTIFISQPSSIADGKEQQFYQLPDEYSINDINYFFLEAQGS